MVRWYVNSTGVRSAASIVVLAVPRKLQNRSTKALVRARVSTSRLAWPARSPGVMATDASAAGMPFQATRYSSRCGCAGRGDAAAAAAVASTRAAASATSRPCGRRSGFRLVAGLLRLGFIAALVFERLLEVLDSLAERAADLGQLAGTEDEQGDDQDDEELGSTDSEHLLIPPKNDRSMGLEVSRSRNMSRAKGVTGDQWTSDRCSRSPNTGHRSCALSARLTAAWLLALPPGPAAD